MIFLGVFGFSVSLMNMTLSPMKGIREAHPNTLLVKKYDAAKLATNLMKLMQLFLKNN